MRPFIAAAAVGFALSLPVPGTAQTVPAPARAGVEASQLRAKQLMDRDVFTNDGMEVGEIEDLILDPASGRVVAVVIEVERQSGLADRYVTVDLGRLRVVPGERRVTLDLDRGALRSLPGIDYRD